MTEEQIKERASKFATTPREYEAYITGAHSRDEEIKHLEEQLEITACDMIAYKAQVEQLRNPWISVEERLPEKTKGVFSCQVRQLEKDKIVYYKDTRGYIHTGYLNAINHWRDLDRDNGVIYPVTHWMPIHELKKVE